MLTEAHAGMVDRLKRSGVVQSPSLMAALRTVPRHHFVDDVGLETAYADIAISVKTNAGGESISSISQPTIVASMLELCEVQPGQTVLEIGTGTGYNAALLACLVGPKGRVVSVELEADLATAAKLRLRQHEFTQVKVVVGDGAKGHAPNAPYDRIVVTTGAPKVHSAWVEQLRPEGRLITPVVNSDGIGTVECLVKHGETMTPLASVACGFLVMRSR